MNDTPIRTSSRQGLRESALGTRHLMTICALGIVGSLLTVPLQYVSPLLAVSPRGIIILCVVMGAWLIPYLLPAVIVPRPGAIIIASLVMGIVMAFTTPLGFTAIIGSLIGGLFTETPLALLLYKKWTWWSYGISATVFGAINAAMFGGAYNIALTSTETTICILSSVLSCWAGTAICCALKKTLTRTGVGIHR
ncbi:ECF transporter S component [Schaalia suimastitidis]|uniref:ECF transporter S component n=1 Tax=Schaalia suimastitidis TaxID=121163 RepID=UPI000401EDA4|nr:ECF transporter S component [Schaalia suimastitidis]